MFSVSVGRCTAWKGDNQGPHLFSDALKVYTQVQAEFPNAKIKASDAFDDFVDTVLPFVDTLAAGLASTQLSVLQNTINFVYLALKNT